MKKAKNKKQLNNEVPEIKAYLSLSKNSPLIIAKAFLLLIQEERGNFKKRRNYIIKHFSQDVRLYKNRIKKKSKNFVSLSFKQSKDNEELFFEFGSEAYFETYFQFFNALDLEEEEMDRRHFEMIGEFVEKINSKLSKKIKQ